MVVAVEAVSRAAILAEWTGARIHILHISSAEELRPLREAKARGVDITGETCPHYLLLSTDDYHACRASSASIHRCAKHNQEPLWQRLLDGTIDFIATDHAPHTPEEKTRNDIWTVDCGFPGVETQMPLMLTEVNAGRMSICDYVRMSSFNPARSGVFIRVRARFSPARDADFAIVDLARDHTHRRCGVAIALENFPLEWPPGKGSAASHACTRTFRHEGSRTSGRHERLGSLCASSPGNAAAGSCAMPRLTMQAIVALAARRRKTPNDRRHRTPSRRQDPVPTSSSSWRK